MQISYIGPTFDAGRRKALSALDAVPLLDRPALRRVARDHHAGGVRQGMAGQQAGLGFFAFIRVQTMMAVPWENTTGLL